jgi:hypothetical protein
MTGARILDAGARFGRVPRTRCARRALGALGEALRRERDGLAMHGVSRSSSMRAAPPFTCTASGDADDAR